MFLSLENIMLIGSLLLFISIIASKTGYKFGVPVLLLFLAVGMLAGSDGIGGITYSNSQFTQFIGMLALSIILFSGGMDTKYEEIRPVAVQGVLLATIGVLLTAIITGFFIYWLTNNFFEAFTLSLFESLLLASVMSSTDSASVFAILRSKGLFLKHRLRPLLELESGSNDPMAYMLMIVFLQVIQSQTGSVGFIIGMFFYQLIVGALAGYLLGRLTVRIINKINLNNDALYPVLLLTMAFTIFSLTDFIKGNGYLAVYIGGLVVGNSRFIHKRTTKSFFDGFAWLAQIVMFLTLGLLVNPSELLPVVGVGLLVGVFMIFFSRPISVWLCLALFRKMPAKAKHYVAWVGLRGAVPIIFATYILTADIPHASVMFNIVFFITIVSLLVQGTSVPFVARMLGLAEDNVQDQQLSEFDVEFSEDIKSAMTEIMVKGEFLQEGNTLVDIPIPENTLVVMVKRDNCYFVPRGNTEIEAGDILLLISDDEEALRETYKKLGIDNYPFQKN
ncbi:MAG: potassium/proton antiporter [Prevotellaceae bacterium]|jgi:cell volume regulation protein A|nr:potassium/proton antiporter [Prevotellaceae bacterium]